MLHSRTESGHDFVSAREYALSILTSRHTRETFSTTSLESSVKVEVITVED